MVLTDLNTQDPPRYPYVELVVTQDQVDEASALLWELGAQGIEQRDAATLIKAADLDQVTLVASYEDVSLAKVVCEGLRARWPAQLTFVEGDAWRDGWKRFFKTQHLGKRLIVRPSWEPLPQTTAESVVVTIDPGRAFGSGMHETTRLVLQQLDASVQGGEKVLDVGCGSGILSMAACKLGAASALATDIDPDALLVTQENAAIEQLPITTTEQPPGTIEQTFDFVLANIEARVLKTMAPELCARVKPGGRLILSGILFDELAEMRAAFSSMQVVDTPQENQWIAMVLMHP